jgi:hypothetical protein
MTSSIAAIIASKGRSLFVSHIEPHLVADISPEMFEQLYLEALRGLLILPLVMLGAFSVVGWLFDFAGIGPLDGRSAVVMWR